MKGRGIKYVFPGKEGGHKEMMNEGGYGVFILYLYMKIEE
jgi:hypothetical protein